MAEAGFASREKHHIIPRAVGGSNKAENKIMLCPNCHSLTHKGKYSKENLIIIKDNIENIPKKDNEKEQKEKKPLSLMIHTKVTITKDNKDKRKEPGRI